ncbi:MAG: Glycosyl transferase family 2 [uncultured bacterium]|uniref:Glycosyltransferase n=3 Tax=Candidatus Daviesiibacteriota TaxID=1752718 RepID=A0A0G0EP96_9BACT|nr:MAG: Glycosyl transferase family 2 [uncultured bacterium]KKQ08818.1 MAG: Glycosyltransferase [Candidatus Daviesbacteria bacterium GW2011_GWB1_36_5]KKQ81051.1 MAG: Glycosyltransferase [Candidatus Daviesbacteria bacterium GW2011_GWA1_38_7]OGE17470.1 MAG: hypothetical protein A2858_01000 [Candidatus Daviesbacteria bacterium RIFCSPHIGHO2_01_FULL_36_37]OGE36565.1 MAG: hypothetical protein A3E66_02845 [Candidatus Daviesbacteria bacterium RIFCSPHIGHO2_12_FULL_37_16]
MKKTFKFSVIIPFFNEEKTIEKIVRKVHARKEVDEIVLIDDGSKDSSFKKASRLNLAKLKIFQHKKNKGKGAAMLTGLRKASGDVLLFQDADLECFPSDYPKLLKPLLECDADFVIGTRWENHNGYFLAQMGNRLLTTIINVLFFTNYRDAYCGYKLARKEIFTNLGLSSKGFEIEGEIASKVALKRLRMEQVNVKYKPRSYKEGKKINYKDVFKGMKKIMEVRTGSLLS